MPSRFIHAHTLVPRSSPEIHTHQGLFLVAFWAMNGFEMGTDTLKPDSSYFGKRCLSEIFSLKY